MSEINNLNTDAISCRSVPAILEKIEFYKSEQERYEQLAKKYPNDYDYKRELYGFASKVFALEWVLKFKYK
jgi:hypothetical protein